MFALSLLTLDLTILLFRFVFPLHFPKNPCRVSCRYVICWNILVQKSQRSMFALTVSFILLFSLPLTEYYTCTYLCNHTPGTNSTPIPNHHPRQNNHTPGNPAILANGNTCAHLGPIGAIAQVWIQGVRATEKRHVRADQGSGSYGDLAGVDECAVEINKNPASDADVCAVVDVDGSFEPGISVQRGVFVFFCGCGCGCGCGCWWEWEWFVVVCYSLLLLVCGMVGRSEGRSILFPVFCDFSSA